MNLMQMLGSDGKISQGSGLIRRVAAGTALRGKYWRHVLSPWNALFICGLILIFFYLYPVFGTGFINDDAQDSLTHWVMRDQGVTLVTFARLNFVAWLHNGRFFPLSMYALPLFDSVRDIVAYKAILVLATVLDIALFSWLSFELTGSTAASAGIVVFSPIFLQFRMYHDSILSYHALQQVLIAFFACSLTLFVRFVRSNRPAEYVASIVLFVACALLYENSYLLWLCYVPVAMAANRDNRRRTRLLVPYCTVAVTAVAISIAVRWCLHTPIATAGGHDAYVVNPQLGPIIVAYCKQVTAAIPCIYSVFDPDHLRSIHDFSAFSLVMGVAGGAIAWAWMRTSRTTSVVSVNKLKVLTSTSVLVFLVPGILISLSPKYQQELGWGVGYIPVLFSSMGLLTAFVGVLIAWPPKGKAAWLIASWFGVAFMASAQSNAQVVDASNLVWTYPRQVATDALAAGILDEVGRPRAIYVDPTRRWDMPAFYLMATGRRVAFLGTYGALRQEPAVKASILVEGASQSIIAGAPSRCYWRYAAIGPHGGYAVAAESPTLTVTDFDIVSAKARDAYVFTEGKVPELEGTIISDRGTLPLTSPPNGWPIVRSGRGWKIIHVRPVVGLVDLRTLHLHGL